MKAVNTKRKRRAFANLTGEVRELILSAAYKSRAGKRKEDFIRSRKMPFSSMLFFMINQIKTSTQTALDRFFELIDAPDTHMSQQSFSEARQKLKWEACRELMDLSVDSVYCAGYSTWHGYRVSGVDGSKLQLPSDPKLRVAFGTVGKGGIAVTAQSSCLFDVLNDIIIDAQVAPIATDERSLARKHIQHLRGMPSFGKELLLLDRGYPSFDLFELLGSQNIDFLMRVRTKFNLVVDRMPLGDHRYTFEKKGKRIPLRILKFLLPSGEIETLVTSLLDKRMGPCGFKDLYFKRWPVETKYGELKHKLEIENFSCRTEEGVYQDYYITAFLSNMIAVAVCETQPAIDAARVDMENKYDYQVNKNHAVGVFKDRFILALLEPSPRKRDRRVNRIFILMEKKAIPIRLGRSVPRNPSPRKANFHFNQKSNC